VIKHGEGYHAWDMTSHQYEEVLKWLYASSVVYCPAAYFTKVTLLLLIARVYAIEQRVARATYIFIWALLIIYIPIQIMKIAICNPIRSYWVHDIKGQCLPQRKIFLADAALAIVTDLAILVIPVIMTVKLHMRVRKKVKIMCLLGAGGVAIAVTIWRLVALVDFQHSTDTTSGFSLLTILTLVERSRLFGRRLL
jgi:hypothetical protein